MARARRFGLVVGAVALALAALPAALRPVYRVWMLLAVAMGFVMTRVLLTAVFFGLVTPMGLVRRALGHDPMRRRSPSPGTMWIRRDPPADGASPREAMERTF